MVFLTPSHTPSISTTSEGFEPARTVAVKKLEKGFLRGSTTEVPGIPPPSNFKQPVFSDGFAGGIGTLQ